MIKIKRNRILKEKPVGLADELHITYERKRNLKDNSKVFRFVQLGGWSCYILM